TYAHTYPHTTCAPVVCDGLARGSRGDDAKKLCPELNLFAVPEEHGKANLTIFRNKSTEVCLIMANLTIFRNKSTE
ncbi:hypothetical protein SARC_16459, partial [Sphaeroforma arctica JP610]